MRSVRKGEGEEVSKDKDNKPNDYYEGSDRDDARLHRLVSLRLRNVMLSLAYYNKGRDQDGGVFDIVDPNEEADSLISELRFFGFIPEARK